MERRVLTFPFLFVWDCGVSIMQLQKEIGDHELAEQMDEPIVQQLEAEVNGLQLNAQAYNKKQLALRAKAKTITEKREEILSKVLIPALCQHHFLFFIF